MNKYLLDCLQHKKILHTFALPNRRGLVTTSETDRTPTENFILIENKIWKVKKFSYLCTPNHKQGLQTARKRATQLAHTVTLIECGTRSLNDGNRQNSKYLASFGWQETSEIELDSKRQNTSKDSTRHRPNLGLD